MIFFIQTLEETSSSFNGKIKVIKTLEGVRVVVGGISQSGWLVRKIWDHALSKICKERKKVRGALILGLGGGSAAEVVQKYWENTNIVGVEIDPKMIKLGKKYLKLDLVSRLKVKQEDAFQFVKVTRHKFDLIIIDLYKGQKSPKNATSDGFFKDIKQLLTKNGIAVFNHIYIKNKKQELEKLSEKIHKVFPAVKTVQPEANILFICYNS